MPEATPTMNMKLRALAAAATLAAAMLAGGCAGMKKDSAELPLPPQRLDLDGYSFMPPAEPGWFVAERGTDLIVLAKQGKYIGQTLTIQGAGVSLPATPATLLLVNHVRATEAQGLLPPRFRIRSHEVLPAGVAGAACVMSHLEVEDREPGATVGPIVALLLETVSLTCRDATRPGRGVQLSYTQRSFPEDRDPGLRPRAEAMMNTLQLSPAAQR
jgi:hypothetical protein